MDKFEEISFLNMGTPNVKVLPCLPTDVTNGDIVIISNDNDAKVVISSSEPTLNDNEIWLEVKEGTTHNVSFKNITYPCKVSNSKIYNLGKYEKVNLYYGENNSWNLLNPSFFLYNIPYFYNENISGGFSYKYIGTDQGTRLNVSNDSDKGISINFHSQNYRTSIIYYSNKKIDVTNFSKLRVKVEGINISSTEYVTIGLSSNISDSKTFSVSKNITYYNPRNIEFNLDAVSGSLYFKAAITYDRLDAYKDVTLNIACIEFE